MNPVKIGPEPENSPNYVVGNATGSNATRWIVEDGYYSHNSEIYGPFTSWDAALKYVRSHADLNARLGRADVFIKRIYAAL